MLCEITVQHRRAAQTLSQLAVWPKLKELLDAELAAIQAAMIDTMQLVVLHQLQGRAKAIRDLLETVVDATTVLEKIERRPSGLGM